MIFILHGDNIYRSRNALLGLQAKMQLPKQEVAITDTSPARLLDMCVSFDIFGNPPFVVLDISALGRATPDPYIDVLAKIPQKAVLAIFSSKELGKSSAFLKRAISLKAKVFLSNTPPASNIFNLVDSVFSGNRKKAYKELVCLVEDEDVFRIFSMLLYGLRNIAYAKFNSMEFYKMVPFVKKKCLSQATKFSESDILDLFKEFYKIDKGVKIGEISVDMFVPLAMEKVLAKYGI